MHGRSAVPPSALFNAAFITAAMLRKLYSPEKCFSCLAFMLHILWMATTKGGSEIAFVSKATLQRFRFLFQVRCYYFLHIFIFFFYFFGNLITALSCPEK